MRIYLQCAQCTKAEKAATAVAASALRLWECCWVAINRHRINYHPIIVNRRTSANRPITNYHPYFQPFVLSGYRIMWRMRRSEKVPGKHKLIVCKWCFTVDYVASNIAPLPLSTISHAIAVSYFKRCKIARTVPWEFSSVTSFIGRHHTDLCTKFIVFCFYFTIAPMQPSTSARAQTAWSNAWSVWKRFAPIARRLSTTLTMHR